MIVQNGFCLPITKMLNNTELKKLIEFANTGAHAFVEFMERHGDTWAVTIYTKDKDKWDSLRCGRYSTVVSNEAN